MELSLVAAFLGGALALLSPCGALLLPAFFATTVGTRARLVLHAGVFFLGLSLTLVPLGLGASALGSLVTTHRDALVTAAGWLIIVFGALQVVGLGFDLSRVLPRTPRAARVATQRSAVVRSLLLGTASGVAGFCSGPILGAVLTMAATEPSPVLAGVLLAVYGAGMVVPLVLLAAVWTRLGATGRARLRGRAWQVGPVQVHSTSLVTGVLLVAVGVLFLRTNGLASLPQLVPTRLLGDAQTAIVGLGAAVPEPVLIAVLGLLGIGLWAWTRRRSARRVQGLADRAADTGAPDTVDGHRADGRPADVGDLRSGARPDLSRLFGPANRLP